MKTIELAISKQVYDNIYTSLSLCSNVDQAHAIELVAFKFHKSGMINDAHYNEIESCINNVIERFEQI